MQTKMGALYGVTWKDFKNKVFKEEEKKSKGKGTANRMIEASEIVSVK